MVVMAVTEEMVTVCYLYFSLSLSNPPTRVAPPSHPRPTVAKRIWLCVSPPLPRSPGKVLRCIIGLIWRSSGRGIGRRRFFPDRLPVIRHAQADHNPPQRYPAPSNPRPNGLVQLSSATSSSAAAYVTVPPLPPSRPWPGWGKCYSSDARVVDPL